MKAVKKLPREFYTRRDTLLIARELLGKRLVVPDADGARVSGIIVETEAYVGADDKASHAFGNRRTPRTEPMFMRGGIAYVYLIYGIYHQFNVVTGVESEPHAVLIRAVEPEEGIKQMRARRAAARDDQLTSGPGKLCQAFGIDRSYSKADLAGGRVWIENTRAKIRVDEIAYGKRVGIAYAGEFVEKPWRFWLGNNPYVSR